MNSIAIFGSARKSSQEKTVSNTAIVLQRLIASSACDVIDLQSFSIAQYNYENNYPEHDQFLFIIQRIISAPITIIATPVYWYSCSTPVKIFTDRFSDLLASHKELGRQLRGKKFALVSSGAESQPDPTLVEMYSRFCDYLGIIFVGCAHAQAANEFTNPEVVEKIRGYFEVVRSAT